MGNHGWVGVGTGGGRRLILDRPRPLRSGPFHPGDRRGPGDSREHGPPVLELAGGHEAEAEAPRGSKLVVDWSVGPLRRLRGAVVPAGR